MWTFRTTARIACDFGIWHALVTLENDGVPESFFINFRDREPTEAQAAAAGAALALQKNLAEAPSAPGDSLPREVFFDRFTNAEIAAIYRAAADNDDLFAYIKKLEMNPTVNRRNGDVIDGVQLLEAAGLIGPGRAAAILG